MAKKKAALQFEGTVQTVNIKGRKSEPSHQCLFGMLSTDGKSTDAYRLDPFQNYGRYRAMLRLLVDACLNHGPTRVDLRPAKDTPIAHRITTGQESIARNRPASRPRARQIDVWSSIGKVVVLQPGTDKVPSSFTLDNGNGTDEFALESLTNPKRAAAMLQVVAAAFGAGATLRVNGYMDKGKQFAFEIEMGPFQAP